MCILIKLYICLAQNGCVLSAHVCICVFFGVYIYSGASRKTREKEEKKRRDEIGKKNTLRILKRITDPRRLYLLHTHKETPLQKPVQAVTKSFDDDALRCFGHTFFVASHVCVAFFAAQLSQFGFYFLSLIHFACMPMGSSIMRSALMKLFCAAIIILCSFPYFASILCCKHYKNTIISACY